MRGSDVFMESLFTMRTLEDFVPSAHPLRPIREMVNVALKRLDELFDCMYAAPELGGRPSIAPEKLLRAMLLQVFYSIRSERQLKRTIGDSPRFCSLWRSVFYVVECASLFHPTLGCYLALALPAR
ncbi:MAG: transposase [Pseudomonadota bacterium]